MKKILLFHVNIFKQNSLRKLCDDLGIETCVVTDRELPVTLGVIAGMSVPEGSAGSGKPVPFSDEMMVFCGLEPDLLDRFLAEYRNREIAPIPLKAVLTPYNAGWTPGRLCMELKKEQQSIASARRENKA